MSGDGPGSDALLQYAILAVMVYLIVSLLRFIWLEVRGPVGTTPTPAPPRPARPGAGSWYAIHGDAPCACGWGRGHLGRRSAYLCARAWARRQGRPARVVFRPVVVDAADPWKWGG